MDFRGHGSKVSRVRFSANDKFLVTVGGYDHSVLVWEVQRTQNAQKEMEVNPAEDAVIEEDLTDQSKVIK